MGKKSSYMFRNVRISDRRSSKGKVAYYDGDRYSSSGRERKYGKYRESER